jgi:PAS domain S-box-containing protein
MKPTFSPDLMLKKTDLKGVVRIFDYLPGVMFFAKDLEGRFIMANQAFAARFGFKNTHEILGKNDAQIGSSPEIISHYIKKDREVIESGKPQPGIIELFPNENGEHVWYETTKIPLWDTEGKVCGVCGIIKSDEGTKASIEPYLQVERAAECIKQNLSNRLDIDKISKLPGLSVRQVERKFRKNRIIWIEKRNENYSNRERRNNRRYEFLKGHRLQIHMSLALVHVLPIGRVG